ncbi:MAG: YlxR family protein [Actinomycetota bacterium]|nr:YlxR family protein [Actinomycetota bacterium]
MAPADELVRIVAGTQGELRLGRTLAGRGAWLCAGSVSCVDAARRRRAFTRAFRVDVGPDAMAALREAVAERGRIEGEGARRNASVRQGKET